MHRILVVGGAGTVGRQVLLQLPLSGVSVRAMVHHSPIASLPAHVEVVRGDLTIPETLDKCLDGIDIVFLVWCAPAAAAAPALERILRHARRVVFLSSPWKTAHPFFQGGQPNASAQLHGEIERLIEASKCSWTFLRPGIFAANARYWWAPHIRAGVDVVRWPYVLAPTAPIDERDIAAVAVRALSEDGHAGAEYVMTGPESLTQLEQISVIGNVIGRSLRMEEMPRDEAGGLLPKFLLDAWAAAIGHPAFITSTVEEITGKPARTFRDWVVDNTLLFSQ